MPLDIPFSQQTPGIWRGGQVHEIFRDPPGADYPNGDYHLWIGTATIECSADYSYFANAERLHILLDGGGLVLRFRDPEETILLTTGESYTFAGDRPLHATPAGDPVFAFNLIYRQGRSISAQSGAQSGARFVDAAEMPVVLPLPTAGTKLTQIFYGVRGESCVESSQGHFLLQAGDTLIYPPVESAGTALRLVNFSADARLLLAHVTDPDALARRGG